MKNSHLLLTIVVVFVSALTILLSTADIVEAAQPSHPKFITTVAGNGRTGHEGDNGPATDASFVFMDCVTPPNSNGDFYISDYDAHVIRKVNASGVITTIAGQARESGYSGDGGPAIDAKLSNPKGLYFDESSGSIYVADYGNHRIRMISSSGHISTVAGDGTAGTSGENVLATEAKLSSPSTVIGNTKGEIFIADSGNNLIRKIGVDQRISTVAGNGTSGWHVEGGLATESPLLSPVSLAVSDDGEVYCSVSNWNGATGIYESLVLTIGVDGRIRRFAGNGAYDFSGDDGPATDAAFRAVYGIALGRGGEVLYIADTENYRIRMVNITSGIISTIAGNGKDEDAGDGGPALDASLYYPLTLGVARNGDLYVGDELRVRMIYTSVSCFRLRADEPGVCSGNGVCSGEDKCTCNEDYTGAKCSDKKRTNGAATGGRLHGNRALGLVMAVFVLAVASSFMSVA